MFARSHLLLHIECYHRHVLFVFYRKAHYHVFFCKLFLCKHELEHVRVLTDDFCFGHYHMFYMLLRYRVSFMFVCSHVFFMFVASRLVQQLLSNRVLLEFYVLPCVCKCWRVIVHAQRLD